MSKKTIVLFIVISLSIIASAILLPIISHPYAEKMEDPDGVEVIVLLVSIILFFLGTVVFPICFVIWITKIKS